MPNQRPSHGPIAAPRPGYAAPIAALNLARPEAAVVPGGRQVGMPQPSRIQNPFELPFAGPGRGPGSPSPSVHSSTPHPLQPSVTPITPAFIRPASKSPAPVNVSFKEGVATPRKPIMEREFRGNSPAFSRRERRRFLAEIQYGCEGGQPEEGKVCDFRLKNNL